jgi:uroporphyrinogen decarboxylase
VYLAGGKGERFKEWIYKDPEGVEEYLTRLGDFLARCGVFQRIGGVDLIQIFDSHLLSLPLSFTERYRKVLDRFVASLPPPRIYFARGWGVFFPYLKDLPVEGFSLDPQISLRFVRESVGLKYTLQGNLDPVVLLTDRSTIRREVGRMLEGFSSDPAYIANLGHGVLPETPEDHLKYFVDLVHEYSFRL